MIALVYGRTQFPPIGFELTSFRPVAVRGRANAGQALYHSLDRTGRTSARSGPARERREGEVAPELLEQLEAFPSMPTTPSRLWLGTTCSTIRTS